FLARVGTRLVDIHRSRTVERSRPQLTCARFPLDFSRSSHAVCLPSVSGDRRRRADATSAATSARDHGGAMRHPGSVMHAADRVSRSTSPTLFKGIRLAARSLTRANGTGIAPAALATIGDRFGGGRGSYRCSQPFVRLIALVF